VKPGKADDTKQRYKDGGTMVRPARAFERESSQDRPTERDRDEDDEIEYEDEHPREHKSVRPNLRGYSVPLAGVVLVGMLGGTIWLVLSGGHETPSPRAVPELPHAQDRISEASGNTRLARPALHTSRSVSADATLTPENDVAEGTGDSSGTISQGAGPTANHPAEMDPAAEARVSADDLRLLQQRFDRLDTSLQAVQGDMQLVLTEMRSARVSGQAQEALDSADKMLSVLKKQIATRDQEIIRLRGDLAAREHLVKDMKLQAQHSKARSPLAGWEIVGLTVRNAALKDPSGQTHVVSIGETIVDGVQLKQIDPAGTRITTTAGDIAYHAAR
jgi:hypothetical protein